MSKLHVKTGDTVVLLTGDKKDRKKTGKVLEVSPRNTLNRRRQEIRPV